MPQVFHMAASGLILFRQHGRHQSTEESQLLLLIAAACHAAVLAPHAGVKVIYLAARRRHVVSNQSTAAQEIRVCPFRPAEGLGPLVNSSTAALHVAFQEHFVTVVVTQARSFELRVRSANGCTCIAD